MFFTILSHEEESECKLNFKYFFFQIRKHKKNNFGMFTKELYDMEEVQKPKVIYYVKVSEVVEMILRV